MTILRRARPASAQRGPARTVLMACIVFAIAGGFAWISLTSATRIPGIPATHLRAQFSNLSSLGNLNEVRIAGHRVGQVLNARIEDGHATVDLQLRSARRVPVDSRLVVRSKGLLGQRFLELEPGHAQATLRDGATIPASRTSATVELPAVLNALDPVRRRRLQDTISGLGAGFLGRGRQLNGAVAAAPSLFADMQSASEAVLARGDAARQLFGSVGRAATAAEPARDDLAQGFDPEARALASFATPPAPLQDTLATAPSALEGTRAGLAATDPLVAAAAHLASTSARVLVPAPAALEQTRRLLAKAVTPLQRTRTLLGQVPSVTAPVVRISHTLTPVLPRVEAALDDSAAPLRVLAPRECDVAKWASNWRSMLGYGVGGGGAVGPLNVLRLELIVSPESVGAIQNVDPAHSAANPYPAPCQAGTEQMP